MVFLSICRIPPASLPSSVSLPPLYKSKAVYDGLTKAITVGTIVGLAALLAFISWLAITEPKPASSIALVVVYVVVISIMVVPFLFSPKGFYVTPQGVVVKRVLRSFLIPHAEIKRVERVSWTWRGIRLRASGGLYGYFGLFWLSELGRVWMYVTNRRSLVLIESRGGVKYIISPEDPDSFVEILRRFKP